MLLYKIILICVGFPLCGALQEEQRDHLMNFILKRIPHEITFVCKADRFSLAKKLNQANVPHVVLDLNLSDIPFVNSPYLLFSIETTKDLEDMLMQKKWNPQKRYLVVMGTKRDGRNSSKEIMEIFRSNYILNVATAIYDENTEAFAFYTWYPFSLESACGRRIGPVLINRSDGGLDDLFANKIPRIFNKCKFVVGWFSEFPKTEQFVEKPLFDAFGETFNLDIE